MKWVDPLINFEDSIQNVVLSLIGIVYRYREYFYEFDTFLGPPVGHVWVSPGGSLELFEISSRRTLTEREIQRTTEVTTRSEITTTTQDELSDSVKNENQRNEKLGVSASANVNFAVFGASASHLQFIRYCRSGSVGIGFMDSEFAYQL
jgi:hypothetical protein